MNALEDARTPVSSSADPPPPKVARHQEYRRLREPLETELLRRLRHGELIASATEKLPGPTDARFVVTPETFDRVGFAWDRPKAMTGIGSIYNVEIFPPDEVPLNVDPERIPAWLRPASEPEPPPETATPAAAPLEFRHDPDYRHVTLRGREYLLTDKQAKVVKALHEAWLDGTRWVHVERLRELAKFDSAKLAHLFRRMPDWQELILSDRRGYYRQNITD